MLIAEEIGIKNVKIIIPILFSISGTLCLIFSKNKAKYKVPFQFQLLQGLGLITYAIIIFFLPKSSL